MDFYEKLEQARAAAPPSTAKGIRAMILMPEGYTSREIGEQMNVSDKLVCAFLSWRILCYAVPNLAVERRKAVMICKKEHI